MIVKGKKSMMKIKKIGRVIAFAMLSAMLLSTSVSAKTDSLAKANITNLAADKKTNKKKEERVTTKTIKGVTYTFILEYSKNKGVVSTKKMDLLEEMFFDIYPQLYDRFGAYKKAPTTIDVHLISGYKGLAGTGIYTIDINAEYLQSKTDYDFFTHELAHVAQVDWYGKNLEYSQYIENFADYCRYVYAYQGGKYNDYNWELENTYYDREHNGREHSVRFLVWLDYETNSSDKDIIRDYYKICSDGKYSSKQWAKKVWPKLFKNTKFEGKSIDKVWKMYRDSDFSHYDSKCKKGETSELVRKTTKNKVTLREKLKKHSFSQSYEDSLKKQK